MARIRSAIATRRPKPCSEGIPPSGQHRRQHGARGVDVRHDVDVHNTLPVRIGRLLAAVHTDPAFEQKISIRPNADRACSTKARMSVSRETSARNAIPDTSLATASEPAPSTSDTSTLAPNSANRRHIARPIPDAPPVTIITFWLTSMSLARYLFLLATSTGDSTFLYGQDYRTTGTIGPKQQHLRDGVLLENADGHTFELE